MVTRLIVPVKGEAIVVVIGCDAAATIARPDQSTEAIALRTASIRS
jgi:hypothetical protein